MNSHQDNKEDVTLAVKAQKGDNEAFAELVDRFQTRIFSFCYQFFREREIATDMAQETFVRAFRYLNKYDPKRKFSTWIYSIAKNICIDEKRKMDRNRTMSLESVSSSSVIDPEPGQHLKDPSQIFQHLEDKLFLEEAIGELPEKYRAVIILCYFQELPYQEIAEILGLSLNLVKVRIFRAKKQLLDIITKKTEKEVL